MENLVYNLFSCSVDVDSCLPNSWLNFLFFDIIFGFLEKSRGKNIELFDSTRHVSPSFLKFLTGVVYYILYHIYYFLSV